MDLEETKKIIQNKIEADEAAREVRSQIKTYIHENEYKCGDRASQETSRSDSSGQRSSPFSCMAANAGP